MHTVQDGQEGLDDPLRLGHRAEGVGRFVVVVVMCCVGVVFYYALKLTFLYFFQPKQQTVLNLDTILTDQTK